MSYRLKYDATAEVVHDAMPAPASERLTLTLALALACRDPLAHSVPYGEDDGVMRMIITDDALAVIYLGEIGKTLNVVQISYLG